MASSFVILLVLVVLPTVVKGIIAEDCICISKSFGCTSDLVQTGYCDKRCCADTKATDPETGEKNKRNCQCVNARNCPPELPKENGNCHDLVECCPATHKRREL